MYNLQSLIIKNIQIKPEIYEMTLNAPEIASKAKPGQFIEIKVNDNSILLRRPISIMDADPLKNEVKIWYRVIGKGTNSLSESQPGETLDIIGPLGNGFYLSEGIKTIALVGGGTGVAPLVFFSKIFHSNLEKENKDRLKIYAIIGARNKDLILGKEDFKNFGDQIIITTDDGSEGIKGTTIDALKELTINASIDAVLTCGPEPMILAIARICQEKNIFCLVSMESPMACGLGACHGCVIKTKIGYRRVCKEGPIFKGIEVLVD